MGLEPTTPCLQSRSTGVRGVEPGEPAGARRDIASRTKEQLSRGSCVQGSPARSTWVLPVPRWLLRLGQKALATFAATSRTDKELAAVPTMEHSFQGDWNYTIVPQTTAA